MPAGLFFFPLLASVDWQCFGAVRSKGAVLQSAFQPLDLPCLSLESGFLWCGTLCQPSSVSTREGTHSGVGTGAFVKAAQPGLPAFAVVCVFKIGDRFSPRLLMCIPSLLPWLQLSIPAALTTGAVSRAVFSSVRTTTGASASQATN